MLLRASLMFIRRKRDCPFYSVGQRLADHRGGRSLCVGVVFCRAGNVAPVSRAGLAHRVDVVDFGCAGFRYGDLCVVG